MTTSKSPALQTPATKRDPLRLSLAEHHSPGKLDGAWWPQSRDLAVEAADLVDSFPEIRGRVVRGLFSRPDWDESLRRLGTKRGMFKVGSFPSDDTHVMVLSMSTAPARLTLLVIPPDTEEADAQALMAAAPSADANSAGALLTEHSGA